MLFVFLKKPILVFQSQHLSFHIRIFRIEGFDLCFQLLDFILKVLTGCPLLLNIILGRFQFIPQVDFLLDDTLQAFLKLLNFGLLLFLNALLLFLILLNGIIPLTLQLHDCLLLLGCYPGVILDLLIKLLKVPILARSNKIEFFPQLGHFLEVSKVWRLPRF